MHVDVHNSNATNLQQRQANIKRNKIINCRGLQIRPVEEQLKQRVIGKRYCISRKRSHTKEVLAVLGLQSVCQMSRKEREVVYPEWAKLGEYA